MFDFNFPGPLFARDASNFARFLAAEMSITLLSSLDFSSILFSFDPHLPYLILIIP